MRWHQAATLHAADAVAAVAAEAAQSAGAVEAVFSIMCLRENIIPPTLNLDNPSIETKIDLVPHESKKKEINSILSNSFGFGGTNASLIFSRYYN